VLRFRQWVRDLDAAYPVGSPRSALFTSMSAASARSDASQFAWVEDTSGNLAISTVLRLETSFQHSFARLSHDCLPGCGLALPHVSASATRVASRHFADYYDATAERLVRLQTVRDFGAFGYSEHLDRSS